MRQGYDVLIGVEDVELPSFAAEHVGHYDFVVTSSIRVVSYSQ